MTVNVQTFRIGCEFMDGVAKIVAFCSAKVALMDATFAERKATMIDLQPRSGGDVCGDAVLPRKAECP